MALGSALLFGATTPIAKLLTGTIQPVLLAGLFYLGSGTGLALWILLARRLVPVAAEAPLRRHDLPWLLLAISSGGVIAPVLLMLGLASTAASTASLLLNLEGVSTALIAWLVFKENYGTRVILGMAAITTGGIVLMFSGDTLSLSYGALLIIAACLCWSADNNLTRKISAADPAQIACIKGMVAGSVNAGLGLSIAKAIADPGQILLAALVGFFGYGISLVLFVLSLRYIGAARTGAYFSAAPFVGAALSIALLREPLTGQVLLAGTLMAVGLWLHLTERHEHEHWHEAMEHEHLHVHDEHHQHEHTATDPPGQPHSHLHKHAPMWHKHPHYPDIHHRHEH